MNKEKNETHLTVAELKNMGDKLDDISETIELYNHALNLVPNGENIPVDNLYNYYKDLYKLANTMFHKNQKLMTELSRISLLLVNNDDEKEIEELKAHFN